MCETTRMYDRPRERLSYVFDLLFYRPRQIEEKKQHGFFRVDFLAREIHR